MVQSYLPLFLEGQVVKGFGRGSKQLGCPTANYPLEVVKTLPEDLKPGVYYGWAQVDTTPVQKMVANIGWCPFYQNKEMSVETHIMHNYERDFYGSQLRVCILGYLRGEQNFGSLEELKTAIQNDIDNAERLLEKEQDLKNNEFFTNITS